MEMLHIQTECIKMVMGRRVTPGHQALDCCALHDLPISHNCIEGTKVLNSGWSMSLTDDSQ